mgnify:CR=1 FL=1
MKEGQRSLEIPIFTIQDLSNACRLKCLVAQPMVTQSFPINEFGGRWSKDSIALGREKAAIACVITGIPGATV